MRFDVVCIRAAKLIERRPTGLVAAICTAAGIENYHTQEEVMVRLARALGLESGDSEKCEKHLSRWGGRSLPSNKSRKVVIAFLHDEANRFRRELGAVG